MAIPFVRLGLTAADKLVDAHFHKINDDVFTHGRRKQGLKRLATPRKYNKYHSSSRDLALASGAGAGAAAGAGTSNSDRDHGHDGDDSTSSESEPEHRPHTHSHSHSLSRSRRSRARSVDRYYHPSYDYTHDPRYRPAPFEAPRVADGYAQDQRAQERNFGREGGTGRVYEPPVWGETEGRERRERPGLKKRSSSVGDLRDGRYREGRTERDGRRDERRGGRRERGEGGNREDKRQGKGITGRLGEWKEKEGTLSLIAAGVMAGSAVLLHV